MSEGSDTILTIVILALATIFALIAWVELRRPGKVVIDEPYEPQETAETRYRKAGGEDLG
jgi:hypothetical protein